MGSVVVLADTATTAVVLKVDTDTLAVTAISPAKPGATGMGGYYGAVANDGSVYLSDTSGLHGAYRILDPTFSSWTDGPALPISGVTDPYLQVPYSDGGLVVMPSGSVAMTDNTDPTTGTLSAIYLLDPVTPTVTSYGPWSYGPNDYGYQVAPTPGADGQSIYFTTEFIVRKTSFIDNTTTIVSDMTTIFPSGWLFDTSSLVYRAQDGLFYATGGGWGHTFQNDGATPSPGPSVVIRFDTATSATLFTGGLDAWAGFRYEPIGIPSPTNWTSGVIIEPYYYFIGAKGHLTFTPTLVRFNLTTQTASEVPLAGYTPQNLAVAGSAAPLPNLAADLDQEYVSFDI